MAQQQLIAFEVGEQVLAVDIMAIRELRAWSPATPVPNCPPHVRGIVNLRGIVLPVIDLRQLIGWGASEPSERHVIIVVQVADKLQGLIVDAVDNIITIDPAELQPPPDLGRTGRLIDGIATDQGRMVLVLALAALAHEQGSFAEAA